MGKRHVALSIRFWARVDHSTHPHGCLEWTGSKTNGYGVIGAGGRGGKLLRAHRVAWQMVHGPVPAGMDVCHHCDNRACVRVDHLFLGTRLDNMRDCVAKGRQAKGSMSPQTKLDANKVRCIRAERAEGATYPALARKYNVACGTIQQAVERTAWRHVQ